MLNVLILAAGLGTRLRPLTNRIAKPLIPIADNCTLGRQALLAKKIGADYIHANAHHLAEQIEKAAPELGVDKVWFEPEILGTGGPLQRMFAEGCRGELLVLNGDAEHSFDLAAFLNTARNSGAECALLGIDNPKINTLCIDGENRLIGVKNKFGEEGIRNATFTGISWYSENAWAQVEEKDIRDYWAKSIKKGGKPLVQIAGNDSRWIDIGSPDGLMDAVSAYFSEENPQGFLPAGSAGSGRKYYRMASAGHSLLLQTTPLQDKVQVADFERFVRYGQLFGKFGLPVPEIYAVSEKEKRVVLEDLGSTRLCDFKEPIVYYPTVLEKLITWQESSEKIFESDSELANRKFGESDYLWESSYFAENYLQNHLDWKTIPEEFQNFFKEVAQKATAHRTVLMHRDFQSQNIMVTKENKIAFIDFQGARNGSIYYDVASLLWDPYQSIPAETVRHLFTLWHSANPLLSDTSLETAWEDFLTASVQRLMQALGAYCFLSKKKGIASFEQYIEPGAKKLKEVLQISNFKQILW